MKISVIIPTYSDLKTLPQTVETVLDQAGVSLEVCVVNDAGPCPAAVLPEDPRLRLVSLAENSGPSSARNRGLSETSGDIVLFLDADDVVAPGMLRCGLAQFADPDVHVLAFEKQTEVETAPGHALSRPPAIPAPADGVPAPARRRLDAAQFCAEFALGPGHFLPSSTLFRRSALLEGLPQPVWCEGIRNSEDTLLYLSLADRYALHELGVLGTTYRIRANSLNHADPYKAWMGRMAAMQVLLDRPAGETNHEVVRKTAWHLRQNAARRVARIYVQNGRKSDAMALLKRYMWAPFDPKMALALLRTLPK